MDETHGHEISNISQRPSDCQERVFEAIDQCPETDILFFGLGRLSRITVDRPHLNMRWSDLGDRCFPLTNECHTVVIMLIESWAKFH